MRRLMRLCKYGAFTLIGILIPVIGAELIFFYAVLEKSDSLTPADAIVIFSGSSVRFEAGHNLAKAGLAPRLIVSPADKHLLDQLRNKYNLPESVRYLIEDQARTTFENALFTQELALSKGLDNIILVTSFYHMPRAYFLLRLSLVGSGVKIQTFQVKTGEKSGWQQIRDNKKLLFNEMVELWGSLFEALRYKLTGRVPEEKLNPPLPLLQIKRLFTFRNVKYPI